MNIKRFSFNSIRSRLTTWFLVLTLIPLLVVLIITSFQRVRAIQNSSFDKLTAIRNLKAERLNNWLDERVGNMYALASDGDLSDLRILMHKQNYDGADSVILENTRQHLNSYLNNYSAYNEMFIIHPLSGEIIISTNESMEGEVLSDAEYFVKPMQTGELYIRDIYYSRILTDISMTYSIPVFDDLFAKNEIVGVLVARIDLHNTLYPILSERVGLGNTGETLIVNKEVVALNELRWYDDAPLSLKISAKPAVMASQGETGIIKTLDYRDEKVLAAYTYIPKTGWGFVCKQDMSELNMPIVKMIREFGLIFIIASLIISLLAFSISKSISKPIVEMDLVAQKIAMGDFSTRNVISSNDELGSLAFEFNNMAEITESRIKVQQGIVDISKTMIRQTTTVEFRSSLIKLLMEMTAANMSVFYTLNEAGKEYKASASIGADEEILRNFSAKNPAGEFGHAFSKKTICHLQEIPESTVFRYKTIAGEAIPKEIITIPVLIKDDIVAIISLVTIKNFSKECYDILELSWGNINTTYSNLLAGEQTLILADHLTKTNSKLEIQSKQLQSQTEELLVQAEELQSNSDELQRQNRELEKQRKRVETANKLKTEFLSNMSHELRTPLNSIMALSNVLIKQTKDKIDEEEINYLRVIERNGKRLLVLINEILDLSKIEAGKVDIKLETSSISSLLQLVKENMQAIAEQKELSLSLHVADEMPSVKTDESRLHQVLLNIVGNAVKFTEKGGVDISATHDSERVFIKVKDTGIGISQKELPYIFDEFRQADGSSSRKHEGTGLGLAIADKIIKILGGEIRVESNPEKGSVFTISIPIQWHQNA
ncbi:MAG: HAMP domain-containing protein [Bacteroidales bacterium]|nr:HAMP domain-containing protein [Bacteroidales bacterium]